jgi:hypothetical protein
MQNTFEKIIEKVCDASSDTVILRQKINLFLINTIYYYPDYLSCSKYGIDNRN